MFRVAIIPLAAAMLAAPAAAHATAFSDQAKSEYKLCKHHSGCWPQYNAVFLGVNAVALRYDVAVGVARAQHRAVQACTCRAGKLLQSDQRVMLYSRRRFRSWWKNPGTGPGRRLKNCLIAAGGVLVADLTKLAVSGEWDDADTASQMAAACGFAAFAGGG